MNKLFYWIGLPICFMILCGTSYLIPNTYQSVFVIAQENENIPRMYQIPSVHGSDPYNLGFLRSGSEIDRDTYSAIISSDAFLVNLLDMPVRTLDGSFDGTYSDYCLQHKKTRQSKEPIKIVQDEYVPWTTIQQEKIKNKLLKSIEVKVDNISGLVSITCRANDPLVAVMIANHVQGHLRKHIEANQQKKKQQVLTQLSAIAAQAKADYTQDPTKEKEDIYKSFAKQEVTYKGQMAYSPAFVVVSEPSFSYKKEGPSHVKIPLLITLIIGVCVYAFDKRREIVAFFHED